MLVFLHHVLLLLSGTFGFQWQADLKAVPDNVEQPLFSRKVVMHLLVLPIEPFINLVHDQLGYVYEVMATTNMRERELGDEFGEDAICKAVLVLDRFTLVRSQRVVQLIYS